MNILLIYACTDKFSHDDYTIHRQMMEGDWSKQDMENVKADYKTSFQKKRISKLGVVHINVESDGTVTVIENLQGTNELATRREINPAAVAAKAARKANVSSKKAELLEAWAASPTVIFDEVFAGTVQS